MKLSFWINVLTFSHISDIEYAPDCARDAAILMSASCVGNDGKSCPLLHGSIAPQLFSVVPLTSQALILTRFLLNSNNITWVHKVSLGFENLRNSSDTSRKIVDTLIGTRYFSRSIKAVKIFAIDNKQESLISSFIANHCHSLEHLELIAFQPFDLSFIGRKAATLNKLDLCMWGDPHDTVEPITVPFDQFFNLKSLRLGSPTLPPNLNHISNCESLEVLELARGSNTITDADFSKLRKLKNLRELAIDVFSNVTSECLSATLASFTFLRKLQLRKNTTDGIISQLSTLPLFEDLILHVDSVARNFCENLTQITGLKVLRFTSPFVTIFDLEHLTKLEHLYDLEIGSEIFEIECWKLVCGISSLKRLITKGYSFDDDDLVSVPTLKNLEYLILDGTYNITGSGFHHLYEMNSLRKFSIPFCERCKVEEIVALQKRLPSLSLELPVSVKKAVNEYLRNQEAKAGTRRARF
jgi:hypothetical protein